MTQDERAWLLWLRHSPSRPTTIYDRRLAADCARRDLCAETGDGTGRYYITTEGRDALDAELP